MSVECSAPNDPAGRECADLCFPQGSTATPSMPLVAGNRHLERHAIRIVTHGLERGRSNYNEPACVQDAELARGGIRVL